MIISKDQMQRIVEEMEHTIHHHINIMDESGHIIASTDPARIGMLHSAAAVLLEQGLDQLAVTKAGEETYPGSKQGVNLPIIIHKKVAGVVGISGEPDQVRDFGAVIKRMTEILISEALSKDQALLCDNAKNTFLYSWLFENFSDPEAVKQLELSGRLLGIDTGLSRIAVVMRPVVPAGAQDALETQQLLTVLDRTVTLSAPASQGHVTLTMGTELLLLFHGSAVRQTAEVCRNTAASFLARTQLPLAVGVGTCGTGREELRKSCREAERACCLSMNTRGNEIKYFAESDVSFLLQQLSPQSCREYLAHLFPGCGEEELHQWMLLLRIFFDCSGSITQASKQLFIHKNTLQYRLNKLRRLTGCDPRDSREAFSLYAALAIYESIGCCTKN